MQAGRAHRQEGFDPETVTILRSVLDAAWSSLSEQQKAEVSQSLLAERILKTAARGERDPVRLKATALMAAVPISEPRWDAAPPQ